MKKLDKEIQTLQDIMNILKPLTREQQVKVLNGVLLKQFPKELAQIELEFELRKLDAFQSAVKKHFG